MINNNAKHVYEYNFDAVNTLLNNLKIGVAEVRFNVVNYGYQSNSTMSKDEVLANIKLLSENNTDLIDYYTSNFATEKVKSLITTIIDSRTEISDSSEELSATSQEVAAKMEIVNEATKQISSGTQELSSNTEEVSASVEDEVKKLA